MTRTSIVQKALWSYVTALSFLLASCGMSTEFYRDVEDDVSEGRYYGAIDRVRDNRPAYGDKSTVLFNLDMGLLFHYAGEPDSSIKYFFEAEREIDELYTKSVSLAAISFILNDNLLPYEGENFEKVLINVFLALNYAEKGLTEDALVEARKVDLKLRALARQYEEKNKYKEDAFIRYIAGALYESDAEVNDAFISYRNAYETYRTYATEYGTTAPSFLLNDIVRTATLLNFNEEAERYRSLGGQPYVRPPDALGSVLVVAYAGRGPIKEEIRSTVTVPDAGGILHTFQIALPRFVSRASPERFYRITALSDADTVESSTELAEDITAIASKSLKDRLGLIYLKSGGRALLKFIAAEKAKSKIKDVSENKVGSFLGSLAVDVVVGATEQADVRTWRTLPAEIQLARFELPPGNYTMNVNCSDERFSLRDVPVEVRAGKTSFVIVDDVR